MIPELNPGGSEIFCTHPDWSWGSTNCPPPSSNEIKEREELYLYSPSWPSGPVLV